MKTTLIHSCRNEGEDAAAPQASSGHLTRLRECLASNSTIFVFVVRFGSSYCPHKHNKLALLWFLDCNLWCFNKHCMFTVVHFVLQSHGYKLSPFQSFYVATLALSIKPRMSFSPISQLSFSRPELLLTNVGDSIRVSGSRARGSSHIKKVAHCTFPEREPDPMHCRGDRIIA